MPKPAAKGDLRQERLKALSAVIAQVASADELVQRFREDDLHGELIDEERVYEWVERQGQIDGEPTSWLTGVPLPAGHIPVRELDGSVYAHPPIETVERIQAEDAHMRYLRLSALGPQELPYVVPTTHGGVLERLRRISSEYLAPHYMWQEDEAATFVLTGRRPRVEDAVFEVRSGPGPLPILPRVFASIDPTLPPSQLASIYQNEYRSHSQRRRHRSMEVKNLQLAKFVSDRPTDEEPRDRMDAWSEEFPEWGYDSLGNFNRDADEAVRKLLRPAFEGEEANWGKRSWSRFLSDFSEQLWN